MSDAERFLAWINDAKRDEWRGLTSVEAQAWLNTAQRGVLNLTARVSMWEEALKKIAFYPIPDIERSIDESVMQDLARDALDGKQWP